MKTEILTITDGCAVVKVDKSVIGQQPVLKAAHKFTNKAHVQIESDGEDYLICRIKAKNSLENIEHLGGDFVNELLDQELRAQLASQTEPLRQLIIAQAYSKTNLVNPDLDYEDANTDSKCIGISDDKQNL